MRNTDIYGDEEIRTPDILLAKQALYQLSYVPAPPAFGAAERKSTPCERRPALSVAAAMRRRTGRLQR